MSAKWVFEFEETVRRGVPISISIEERNKGRKDYGDIRSINPGRADEFLRDAEVVLPDDVDQNYGQSRELLENIETLAKKHGTKKDVRSVSDSMSIEKLKKTSFISFDGIYQTATDVFKVAYEFRDVVALLAFAKLATSTILQWQKNQNSRMVEIRKGDWKIRVSNRGDLGLAIAELEKKRGKARMNREKKNTNGDRKKGSRRVRVGKKR